MVPQIRIHNTFQIWKIRFDQSFYLARQSVGMVPEMAVRSKPVSKSNISKMVLVVDEIPWINLQMVQHLQTILYRVSLEQPDEPWSLRNDLNHQVQVASDIPKAHVSIELVEDTYHNFLFVECDSDWVTRTQFIRRNSSWIPDSVGVKGIPFLYNIDLEFELLGFAFLQTCLGTAFSIRPTWCICHRFFSNSIKGMQRQGTM